MKNQKARQIKLKEQKEAANETIAVAKTIRITPRKVRLVIDLVRGKSVGEAMAILRLTPKASSAVVAKLLKSAVANAENNQKKDQKNLYVKKIFADDGITMKRYLPRAKGSANELLKRTSNITIVLGERE